MTDVLTVERDGGVAIVTMNRPAALNALTKDLKQGLLETVDELGRDEAVRAVVLTGAGRGFCAGQDLTEVVARQGTGDTSLQKTLRQHLNPITMGLATMPKPVIAAVNGAAAGAGAGLACACDFRIASRSATFLLAFARVGLTVDTGISWTLPRLIGSARAMALSLLAEPVSSEAALEMGLVNAVVEPEQLMAAATELAVRLANGPTAAYAAIKESLAYSATASLADAIEKEAELQDVLGYTEDHVNAAAAFVAKQKPTYLGR